MKSNGNAMTATDAVEYTSRPSPQAEAELGRKLDVLVTFHTNRRRKGALVTAVAALKSAGWDQAGAQGILNLFIERKLDAFLAELLAEAQKPGGITRLKSEIAGGPVAAEPVKSAKPRAKSKK